MKNNIFKLLIIGSFIFQGTGIMLLAKEKVEDSPQVQTAKQIGTSNDRTERQKLLNSLSGEYDKIKHILWENLTVAKDEHLNDRSYYSPLHTAVLAVNSWKVYEAERTLFSIIGYKLDLRTFPDGISISGDSFYPAASALADFRVLPERIITQIREAKNENQIQILTWVLARCCGDDFEKTELLLNLAKDKKISDLMKKNIDKSLDWLKKAENVSSLLPFPYA